MSGENKSKDYERAQEILDTGRYNTRLSIEKILSTYR